MSPVPAVTHPARGPRTPCPRPPLAGLLLGALALGACSSLDAKTYNLGELHHEDGKPSYSGALMGDGEYLVRRAFSVSAPFGFEFDFANKDPEFVKNPTRRCLEQLLELDGFHLDDERALALRTEMYAWLATGDDYVLARERCVLELGEIGRRLRVQRPIAAPAEEQRVSAEETSDRIATLIAAAAPLLIRGEPSSGVSLAEACRAISERELDLRAGRRVLRTCAVLLGAPRASRKSLDPLRQLARDTSARLTAIALGEALHDRSPVVRAAALQAWNHATAGRAGELLVEALGDVEAEVVQRVFREVAEHGIPRPMEPLDPAQLEAWDENWIANLVKLSGEHPDGSVSVAACQALARVTDAGLTSLRFEDWYGWWQERAEARLGQDRVREAAP